MYKSLKIIFIPVLIVAIIALVLLLQSWLIMSSETAKLSGSFSTGLLNGKVEILTDSSSFYTVKAESPADLAFGLGYLNASEKLFETSFLLLAIKGEASKTVSYTHLRAHE
ncbi:MAG: penicillin acylase family protein, partial [Ignavibacteriaceae bacterium]|nr:penicillin acylase family protein [Ignavibacteriaceae bacterium]